MFQAVYDYPYLSSSANHIFDITMGYDESSVMSASAYTQNSKKINMYRQTGHVIIQVHKEQEIFQIRECT